MIDLRRGASFVSLVVSLGFFSGCPKKTDTDGSKKDTVTKDDDGKKKGGDDDDDKAGYADGDVLAHVPQKCAMGRFYVNVGALSKDPAIKPTMKKLDDKIAESMKGSDGKKYEAARKALDDAGIDPGRDIREFAMCMQNKKDMVLAIGGDFADKDPLTALQKAIVATDEPKPKKKEADGISYLQTEKVAIGQVTPNVLVFSEDTDLFADVKDKQKISDAWNLGDGRLATLEVKGFEKGVDVSAMLTNEGDDVQFKASIEVSGPDAKKMKSDPDTFAKGVKDFVTKAADKLDGTPLEAIADDLRAVKVKVDGNTVTLTAKIPNKHLASVLKKVMDSSEQDLEDAFK